MGIMEYLQQQQKLRLKCLHKNDSMRYDSTQSDDPTNQPANTQNSSKTSSSPVKEQSPKAARPD